VSLVFLTADALVAQARWDPARLASLPGRCRGDLLGPWGRNLMRRFGVDAVERVRRRLEAPLDRIEPVLTKRDWVPAHAQIAVTEAIVDEMLAGDLRALYPLLLDDTRTSLGRIELALVRSLGPARALALAPRTFHKVHDQGDVEVAIDGRRGRVAFTGNPLFGHPTWRVLQLFAHRVLLELAGSPGEAVGEATEATDAFTVIATW
jgi:hypothetical protein